MSEVPRLAELYMEYLKEGGTVCRRMNPRHLGVWSDALEAAGFTMDTPKFASTVASKAKQRSNIFYKTVRCTKVWAIAHKHGTKFYWRRSASGLLPHNKYHYSACHMNEIPIPSGYEKLLKPNGTAWRAQECALGEIGELLWQYCPSGGLAMDLCAGTAVTALAALRVGCRVIVGDRDQECLVAGLKRARVRFKYLKDMNLLVKLGLVPPGLGPPDQAGPSPDIVPYEAWLQQQDGDVEDGTGAASDVSEVKLVPAGTIEEGTAITTTTVPVDAIPDRSQPPVWAPPEPKKGRPNSKAIEEWNKKLAEKGTGLEIQEVWHFKRRGTRKQYGLFLTRDVKKGELVAPYWGEFVIGENTVARSRSDRVSS